MFNRSFRLDQTTGVLDIVNSNCSTVPFAAKEKARLPGDIGLNRRIFADQYCSTPGAFDGTCLNNAIAAAIGLGGGIVDATGLGSLTSRNEIDVGDGTHPVTLILPPNGAWTFNVNNAALCGIKIWNLSRVLGLANGIGGGFALQPFNASTHMDSLVCTQAQAGGSYAMMSDFAASYNGLSGAVFASGLIHIAELNDASAVFDVIVQTQEVNGVGILVNGVCCGMTFANITSNCYHVKGCIPFKVVDLAGFGSGTVACTNCSIDHPGSGVPNIFIDQSAGSALDTAAWNFYNLQGESNATDLTTPLVQIVNGTAKFYGGRLFHLAAKSTAFAFQVGNAPNTAIEVRGFEAKSVDGADLNAIQNLFTGQNIKTDSSGSVPDYTALPSYRSAYAYLSTTIPALPPAATNAGMMMYVTDSTEIRIEGQPCVGRSTNKALAFSNGTIWKCF